MPPREYSGPARQAKHDWICLAALAISVSSTSAIAGQCPEGKAASNPLSSAATSPSRVSDEVLSHIDLAKETVRLDGYNFRLR